MLRTFIQVMALGVTLISSFFLIRGTIFLSAENIAEVSRSKWDYNLDVARNLTQSHVDTKIGFCFILLGFILQLINQLWPMRVSDFDVNRTGVLLAVMTSLMLLLIGWCASHALQENSYKKVEQILKG